MIRLVAVAFYDKCLIRVVIVEVCGHFILCVLRFFFSRTERVKILFNNKWLGDLNL